MILKLREADESLMQCADLILSSDSAILIPAMTCRDVGAKRPPLLAAGISKDPPLLAYDWIRVAH